MNTAEVSNSLRPCYYVNSATKKVESGSYDAAAMMAKIQQRADQLQKNPVGQNTLTQEEIQQIAVHMLNDLKARLEPLGVSLEFTEEAVRTIAKAGFDPVYGARPLRREIQTKVEDPLSEELLAGDLKAGGTAVCDASGGKIIFQIQEKRID